MKEAIANECSHGQLARQCPLCELDRDIRRLETWLEICVHSLTRISCWLEFAQTNESEMMDEARTALQRLRCGGYFERDKNFDWGGNFI